MSERLLNIREVATVVRSKNAGPFKYTFDIVFSSAERFRAVRESGRITAAAIAALYGVDDAELHLIWFAPANALKITMTRPYSAASFQDRDAYGAQQHAPLLSLNFPAAIFDSAQP